MSMPRSILIVDDEFGLDEMLREMLRDEGYDVSLAINGRLALQILAERSIDLVLTDMMMPVMDGAELAAAMRTSEVHRRIPIVPRAVMLSTVEGDRANAALRVIQAGGGH